MLHIKPVSVRHRSFQNLYIFFLTFLYCWNLLNDSWVLTIIIIDNINSIVVIVAVIFYYKIDINQKVM